MVHPRLLGTLALVAAPGCFYHPTGSQLATQSASTSPGTTGDATTALTTTGSPTTGAAAACGDGEVDPGEQCDDGNDISGDGCESDCTTTPECGDGVKGPGEQCDDGNDDDDDACLADCVVATCGDGFIWVGMEACDDGPMNGEYGHCGDDCSGPGPRCGDGERDGPEECDDGNQTDDDACTSDCVAPRMVFVTAAAFNGDLGGLVGADAKCAQAALNSTLLSDIKNAQWLAWISDRATSPANRMDTAYTGYYKLTNGAVLAHGWAELTAPPLATALDVDESGVSVGPPLQAWSNTTPQGASVGVEDCDNWSSATFTALGRFGETNMNDATWTDTPIATNCSNSFHLYCFQSTAP